MSRYLVRRLLQAVLVVIGVTAVSYGLIFLTGDPTYMLLPEAQNLTDEAIAEFRHQMGFDRPWILQYLDYMTDVLRGDLGKSFYHRIPNSKLIAEYMPATIELGITAWVLSLLGIPIGILAATHRGKLVDSLSMVVALIGQAMPIFWLGLLLMLIFAVRLKWLPVSGRGGIDHLILPAVTLASWPLAENARIMRTSILEVLGQDYIRTAQSKGLSNASVLFKHALKNAMIPVTTVIGMQVGNLLGGAVITETIFAWPGVGRLFVQAVFTKDIPLVQTSVIVLSLIFVLINLIVDLSYAWFDPRIRLSRTGANGGG
jgi:peptide/nickel transport system permease protein